jgi:hypothetical protein
MVLCPWLFRLVPHSAICTGEHSEVTKRVIVIDKDDRVNVIRKECSELVRKCSSPKAGEECGVVRCGKA